MNPSFDGDVQFNGVDYWRSREKFKPGAGIRNIVYDAFNRGTRFTKIRKPMQVTFHDPATNRFVKSPPVLASTSRVRRRTLTGAFGMPDRSKFANSCGGTGGLK
jgi:hypothetical protein